MSAVAIAEKTCTKCGETKSLTAFSPVSRRGANALRSECKACSNAASKARQAARRAALGDEAYRAETRAKVSAHRERSGNARGRWAVRTRGKALETLARLHADEFEKVLARIRYEEPFDPSLAQGCDELTGRGGSATGLAPAASGPSPSKS